MPINKISIILTVKNETKFLYNVLRQLCPQNPDELIIVDGNSTDDHIGLYDTLAKMYPFRLLKNTSQDSPFGAFATGIKEAKNEFVSLWSVDDDPYPDYLKKMTSAINTFNADLFICSADVSRETRMYERILYPFDAYVSPECMAKKFQSFGRRINLVGSVIRKSKVVENLPYLTKANFDATYFFHIAFDTGIFNVGKKLILYRSYLNSHGQTGKWKDIKEWVEVSQRRFKETPEVYERAIKAGLWADPMNDFIKLRMFPYLPQPIRRMVYNRIYQYDTKDEK